MDHVSGGDLVAARFRARPHRFAVEAVLADGRRVEAHLADPGRLRELLLPGAPLRLRPAPPGSTRATRYTVALVRASDPPRAWVSVETTRANRLAAELLASGRVHGAGRLLQLRREVRHGGSRFDFVVERPQGKLWVEVKSVTLVERRVALFPDAPTARGRRHVDELAGIARGGERAMVLFVVQRGDARSVRPHRGIDPAFAEALTAARESGVLLRAAGFRMEPGGAATYLGALPVRTRARSPMVR